MNIFFVVDLSRYDTGPGNPTAESEIRRCRSLYYYTDTGLIAANVYLFAASQGLAAWFHNCNRDAAAKDFKLRADQRVLFAQTVGYPASRSHARIYQSRYLNLRYMTPLKI